jgi:hypothetical protein
VISEPPAGIQNATPQPVREVQVGDTIVMQIAYPIAPPFPTSVQVEHGRMFRLIGTYRTDGKVAVLTPKPQQQGVGVGFLSVIVQALNEGKGKITVKVTMKNGTIKSVPFEFQVKKQEP